MFNLMKAVSPLAGKSMSLPILKHELGEIRARHFRRIPPELDVDEMVEVLHERGKLVPIGDGRLVVTL